MAEQNPIKYSDLISPDDSIEKLIKQLEQLQSIYNGVAQSVKDNAAAMAASLRQVSGATEQGRQSTRGASQEADRLTKAYEALNFARSETAHKIAELKEQQKLLRLWNWEHLTLLRSLQHFLLQRIQILGKDCFKVYLLQHQQM